ncbi:MAG: MBL fold metallo-hydrolase [Flavobacteriales bacterium]|nr:MBL fold metallo-hydrolase [Flavobacteriales bacterium]
MILIESFTFNAFQENTYLLVDETGEAIIIDPGMSTSGEERVLDEFIQSKNLVVKAIVNTHCHIDHIMGNAHCVAKYKCPLLYPQGEEVVLESGVHVAQMYGLPYHESPRADRYIAEGETISFGNAKVRVISAPGHSPAHVVFVHDQQRFVIGGDVLFLNSVGRTDLPGGDEQTLRKSIEEKMFTLPDEMMVYPGHGPATQIGLEKQNNPYVNGLGTGLFQRK